MLNEFLFAGRLARDPELRRTGTGKAVTNFTVAVDRDIRSEENSADFFDCVAWDKEGEFISKYFSKGSLIICKSHLQQRSWKDKDGNNRRTTEANVYKAWFGGPKSANSGANAAAEPGEYPVVDDPDAQLPF